MIAVSDFVKRVEAIASRKLTYRTGGVGKDGTCDCIGLIMGAMYELGQKKYDMHSTNYFARYQTLELKKASEKELFIGQLLYRARTNQDKLNARYLPGGRYYTGDLLDYYHVGVVTGVKPLRIIECTEYGNVTGIVIHTSFGNWHYSGKLRFVDYVDMGGLYEPGKEVFEVLYEARVITQEDPLTLRATAGGRKVGEIPKGETVEVLAEGEWALVRYGDKRGYASAQYLEKIEAEEPEYAKLTVRTIIEDSAGRIWEPIGGFSVRVQLEADGEAID